MSDPSDPPETVPVLAILLTIDLPESATPEQREAFHRKLRELGGASTHIVQLHLPVDVPLEKRQAFAEEVLRLAGNNLKDV